MLSVSQAAIQLGVTPARVRALIKDGALPAEKIGRGWAIREENVLQRLSEHPRAGRPKAERNTSTGDLRIIRRDEDRAQQAHEAYDACRRLFRTCPSPAMIGEAASREEASFYMAVSDFFLQQEQSRLVAEGVF